MSKVKIEGNASGTGTLTISAPSTNTDRSLTLPDGAGEILLANGDGSNLTGITTGKVLQVVQSTYTTQSSYTPSGLGTYVSTGLNVSITPTSSSSKILLMFNVSVGSNYNNRRIHLKISGGNASNYIGSGTSAVDSAITIEPRAGDNYRQLQGVLTYLDSPATTSATTYTLQVANEGTGSQTIYLNRSATTDSYCGECMSTAIAMEIGA